MNIKQLTIFGTTLLGIGLSTFVDAAQAPNSFTCTGKHVDLSLTIGSKAEVGIAAAQTSLTLNIGKHTYPTFQGKDITTESTLIGDLWETTLHLQPDLYIEHASVVIPKISLEQAPIKFKSQLILTRVATPFIQTPFVGVVNSSKYIDLSCTASMVYF